jgi:GT2 family glycosyltransferase
MKNQLVMFESASLQHEVDLSVVIVNYNTRDFLLSCLRSLYQVPQKFTFEVIISENGSTDSSEELVRREFPQVLLIQNGRNLGFGAAMNVGAAQARGRYLVVLNPDTTVPPNTLQYLLDYLDSHLDSDIKVVGCRLVGRDGRTQSSCARFPTPLRVFSLFTRLDRILPIPSLQTYYDRFDWRHLSVKHWNHDETREVDTVLGAFFVMSLEIFKQVDGFDKRYFMYYEEVDLLRKIQAAGYHVCFLPEVYVVHYGGEATKQEYARMRFEQQRSLLQYLQKWHGTLAAELIRWFLVILACFRLGWVIVSGNVGSLENSKRLRLKSTAIVMLRGLLELNPRRFSLPE